MATPDPAKRDKTVKNIKGPVAKLAHAHDLKSCLARDVGSSPTWTIKIAAVAKLADAPALGAGGVNPVGVQLSPAAFYRELKAVRF